MYVREKERKSNARGGRIKRGERGAPGVGGNG